MYNHLPATSRTNSITPPETTYRPAPQSTSNDKLVSNPLAAASELTNDGTGEKHMIPYHLLPGSCQLRLPDKRQSCSVVCDNSWVRVEHITPYKRAALYPLTRVEEGGAKKGGLIGKEAGKQASNRG